jgi:tRNA (cytidine/uridine-2'-O-)-methyltransferase
LPTGNLANKWQCLWIELQKLEPAVRIALYQPDIAGNCGTILRLSACFGVGCDIIEPCGFPFSDRSLKRAGMDYAGHADIVRHSSWEAFEAGVGKGTRLVLLSTKASIALPHAQFRPDDILLFGSEGSGVPDVVHARAEYRIRIPMQPQFRSLNVAVSAGIALAEALRQTGQFPKDAQP